METIHSAAVTSTSNREPGKTRLNHRSTSYLRTISLVLGCSTLLTLMFWGPLWFGSGFVGGDLYSYFFPQKAYLADRLHAGEFPLWNNLTGFGYPVLGESQTGAAYPPYLMAYFFLEPNTAYNLQHLLHYFLCFGGVWLYCQRIGMRTSGAMLAAIVFTYGWFPPRACLEWAIVTGAWFPVALWCVESFLQTRWWRYAIGLSLVLGLQLLPGHFHLAFITQLVVVGYGFWRVFSLPSPRDPSGTRVSRDKIQLLSALSAAVVAGFLIGAVQLIPAWELKTRSSRASVGADHDPSYGHLPPLYLSQIFMPWRWYSPAEIEGEEGIRTLTEFGAPWHWFGPHHDLDQALMKSRAGGLTTVSTNKVEAHLYCGLIPLGLACWWLLGSLARTKGVNSRSIGQTPASDEGLALFSSCRAEACFWAVAGTLAVIYATGWLLPIARYIPGFNFFRGPGRYGIVTTFAVAILAGRGFGKLVEGRSGIGRIALIGCVLWSTVGDLWLVSRMVTYATMVPRPAITLRDQSPVRKLLLEQTASPRLYAPMQNLGNLLGVSCLPVYLGIAPSEYADPKFAGQGMPKGDVAARPNVANPELLNWLKESGVTHILSETRLDLSSWQVTLIWEGHDRMLNTAMGRSEPLFLYKLNKYEGRASMISTNGSRTSVIVPVQSAANWISVAVDSDGGQLILRDLNYPGWQAEIDDQYTEFVTSGAFRVIEVPPGKHTVKWAYRPVSFWLGLGISIGTLFVLATISHFRFWHGSPAADRLLESKHPHTHNPA